MGYGVFGVEKVASRERFLGIAIVFIFSLVVNVSSANENKSSDNKSTIDWHNDAEIHRQPKTGETRFIRIKNKKKLKLKKDKSIADNISEAYGPAFGLLNPGIDLILKKQTRHEDSVTTYRYQQQYNGLPVIGAELVAAVDAQQQLNFMSGETALNLALTIAPKMTAKQAKDIALAAMSKWYRVNSDILLSTSPELSIFKASIISPSSMPAMVVWKLTITADKINELLFVDANTGSIIFHLNQVHSALNRNTYTANNTAVYKTTLICDETDPTCAAGDADAQAAHQYAEDTYNFYFSKHGRDGIDGAGGTIISSVHVGPDFQNAAWTGSQMIYGNGFPQADDVVAHELTHGVTEKTSNLFYYYQAGAINESFSDIWGEFVDQTNSGGTDTAAVKWKLGEDVPGIGAVRSMENPPEFSDPDKMTSIYYSTSSDDNGGVHSNSGVNNKAAYLMTDGGTFNGQTISGLGIDKVAKLYYEVQTKHLTSGSDYLDLYNGLIQSCSDLVTATTLISSDCTQVQKALTAVEMNSTPVKGFNPEADLCSAPSSQNSIIFTDNLESGLSKWTFSHNTGLLNHNWVDWLTISPTAPFAASGTHSLYGAAVSSVSDQYAQISVAIPVTGSDEKIFLYFKHVIDLEAAETLSQNEYYDGAVLEYSTNSGTSWNDGSNLIVDGKNVTGIIATGASNPLSGRLSFSASSNGYVSTRANLSSFSGQTILLRWRVATDNSVSALGWLVDDVSVYTCQGSVNSLPVANAGADLNVNSGTAVTLNGGASSDADGPIASYSWVQIGGTVISLSNASTATPGFIASGGGGAQAFKLTVTDSDGLTDTDIVNVIVNTKPNASAGNDLELNANVTATLDGSGSYDSDGTIASYTWTQISGDAVVLSDSSNVKPTFITPTTSQTLSFSLTVTDNDGVVSSADTVNIVINAIRTFGGGGGGCSLNSKAGFNPFMFILLLGLSIIHFRQKVVARNKL